MPKNPNAKTISITPDVRRATEFFLVAQSTKPGRAPRNFSQAVEQGLKLLFNRSGTSVARLLAKSK